MRKTLFVNMFGGPSSGKSTNAAGAFCALKQRGVEAELVTEFAKEHCWRDTVHLLRNQAWVFGMQHERIMSLNGKVDVVITDGPLLHSLIYNFDYGKVLDDFVWAEHRKLWNLNIFMLRPGTFNQAGRYHNEEQSKKIDRQIWEMLRGDAESRIQMVNCNDDAPKEIANWAQHELKDKAVV